MNSTRMKVPRVKMMWVLMVALVVTSCAKKEQEAVEVLRPVRFQEVFTAGAERIRTFSGTSHAGLETRLSFKVSGTVEEVAVKVGGRVKKGQLIARLDPKDYEVKKQQAEASLASARAEERNDRANYERVRQLYENNNASRSELDAARARSESGSAEVRSTEKQLEFSELQLKYTRLRSSNDCDVAATYVKETENVQAGQQVVLLTCGSEAEVEVGVPEAFIAQVEEGSSVSVNFDALPGRTFPARVTEVGVAVTGQQVTYPVTARLIESDPAIRPGMAAEVKFRFEMKGSKDRILVPPVAVGEDREGRFVFILDSVEPGIGVVHRKPVTVGDLTADGIEILDGLTDGDRIVTAGVRRLQDGRRVKMMKSSGESR